MGVYWQSYGWVAPESEVSGIEDEYRLSAGKPRLLYVKEPAPERDPRLDELLEGVRASGDASYKHFSAPEELAELLAADLAVLIAERFERDGAAQLRGGGSLPAQATSFVGREQQLAELESLFAGGARLVTLTGPGGIGKTRLAIEAASRLASRYASITFVPLDGLDSAELVVPTIAAAFGLREPGPQPLERLVDHVGDRSLLLVLDNVEHVLTAAPDVATLLAGAPGLTVLATSRELMRLRGEHELQVPPLAVEDEAVLLLLDRAVAAAHGFEPPAEDLASITEICRRLDGVPLAIELAAPRLRLLSPPQLLERLRARLPLVGARDAPARQRTLEAAIDWSYELLEPDERHLFERLGVFRGSFTVEAVEAVAGMPEALELLAALLDKSLVHRLPASDGMRFAMLTMIREHAYGRLEEAGGEDEALEALAAFQLTFARAAEAGLRTREQRGWKRQVDLEIDSLRVVLGWLLEHERAADLVVVLRGLWRWFALTGRFDEGRAWVRRAFTFADRLEPGERGWLLLLDGYFAFFHVELEAAGERLGRARELFVELGDEVGLALTIAPLSFSIAMLEGEEAAQAELAAALSTFEAAGDDTDAAAVLCAGCRLRTIFGRLDDRELFDRGLAVCERLGDELLMTLAIVNLADFCIGVGTIDEGRAGVERARELMRRAGIRFAAPDILGTAARLAAAEGREERAVELSAAEDALRQATKVPLWGPLAARRERELAALRRSLGAERFEQARARGGELSFEDWLAGPAREPAGHA